MGKKATFILIDKIFTVLSFINAFFIVIFSNNLFISYRDNEISGYLGFIIPFMILLNIIFIIVWLFKKKWIVSIILLICLFCSYNFRGGLSKVKKKRRGHFTFLHLVGVLF